MGDDNYIKLTLVGNESVHVSHPAIFMMREVKDVTVISLFGGQMVTVKESIKDIKSLIKRANQFTLKTETK